MADTEQDVLAIEAEQVRTGNILIKRNAINAVSKQVTNVCLLYTSDAADEE